MFDNLRDDASSFYEEDDSEFLFQEEKQDAPSTFDALPARPRKKMGRLLGMTDKQRFIIVVMLMIAVCTLGTMCLLVTGRMSLI